MHMRSPRPYALGLVPIHTHTPLCGYGLSTGPTEGLSSWWLRNQLPPDSQQQQQQLIMILSQEESYNYFVSRVLCIVVLAVCLGVYVMYRTCFSFRSESVPFVSEQFALSQQCSVHHSSSQQQCSRSLLFTSQLPNSICPAAGVQGMLLVFNWLIS